MRWFLVMALIVFNCTTQAQNLVPNPSFEDYNSCPTTLAQIDYVLDQTFPTVKNWSKPSDGSPDYYNVCSLLSLVGIPSNFGGYQYPRTGNAYVGMIAYDGYANHVLDSAYSDSVYSEYVEAKLLQLMNAGAIYYVSFYTNLLDDPGFSTVGVKLSAVFTDTALYLPYGNSPMFKLVTGVTGPYVTDTLNWQKGSGFYTAHGGEQWITLGCFSYGNSLDYTTTINMPDPHNLSYYHAGTYIALDDVCVTEAIVSSRDTLVDCNQTIAINLSGHSGVTSYLWNTGDTTATITTHDTGTYWVASTGQCLAYMDTIKIGHSYPVLTTSSAKEICRGQSVSLSTSGADDYVWSPATGLSCTHCANPIASPLQTTTYTVTGTNNSTGCTTKVMDTVLVDSAKAAFAVNKDTLCLGDSLAVTNLSTGNGLSYIWYWGDGDTSHLINPIHGYKDAGDDEVVLIVSNAACTSADSIGIHTYAVAGPSFISADSILCVGKAFHFNSNLAAFIMWDFGDSTEIANVAAPIHSYSQAGKYIVTLFTTYPGCPEMKQMDTVTVIAYPIVNIGSDTVLCPGQGPITLSNHTANESSDDKQMWSTGETGNSIVVDKPDTYWLQITSGGACATTDSMVVKSDCYVQIPNAFTPNGDGVNDYFFPREFLSMGLVNFHMQIYDRWGQLIFETNSTDGRGWDGTFNGRPMPEGVYVYMIEATFINNTSEQHKGNITLIRSGR